VLVILAMAIPVYLATRLTTRGIDAAVAEEKPGAVIAAP
jgi:hypothetical protein